ncbi:HD-GYP domain-containing protein [Ectothiorhodospiraceae bacterium WFHF3C12]|nr:HD-GYP domain-containing protein [Ectothiorhodospiraceae bacterium WFHF3C12]
MAEPQRINVEDLLIGLYVAELDRPWLESPFLFQGFRIESDRDLEQLREACAYVYVDPDRSEAAALSRVQASRPTPRRPEAAVVSAVRRREIEGLFGDDPYPNPARFRQELVRASRVRGEARDVVDHLLGQVRAGGEVDGKRAAGVVQHLVRAITRNTTASLWLTSLKQRDEYTAIHCMNVCVLALAFGRFLGMSQQALEVLGLGALLHDIGKMRTPDSVLNKPGPLTEEEFAIMRRHPVDGYEAMRRAGDVSAEVLEIIRSHHERVSGRGYPDGLAGDDIPLTVRVVAIADVYDAMTSDRVYRDAVPAERAIRILYQGAPQDFGRELVEGFIRCIGIFPVGSLVELDSGALGVVISSAPESRLKPVLLMVRTPEGDDYEKRLVLNLAALDAEAPGRGLSVRRVVQGADYGIDVPAIVRAELETSP